MQVSFGRDDELGSVVVQAVVDTNLQNEFTPTKKLLPNVSQVQSTAKRMSIASQHRYDKYPILANKNGSPVFNSGINLTNSKARLI